MKALDVAKSYDGAPLFEGLSLVLAPGDRVGLVGPNGAGKSTLLKLLAGRERPDRGSVSRPPGATIGYLPQEAPPGGATLDGLLHADALAELHASLGDLDRYAAALERVDWTAEARVETVRRRLDIAHLPGDRALQTLSGGEQARALLAATLLEEPDVLLLDEPTNHLDFDTLEVLEKALAASPSTIVAVSHDRWFLDAIGTTRRLHVEGGRLH